MTIEHTAVSPEIRELGEKVLSAEQVKVAEQTVLDLSKKGKSRNAAKARLILHLGMTPKRPLFYLNTMYLDYLPRCTRDSMRYLGDYVDLLLKAAVSEMSAGAKKAPFGSNIARGRDLLSTELHEKLTKFNLHVYQPAKHDFSPLKGDRKHRFTAGEVVFAVYIAKQLATEITTLSARAQRVANDQDEDFWCENMVGRNAC